MGSFRSRYQRATRSWLAFALLAAATGVAVGGCGEEETEAPSPELEAESVAGDRQPATPEDATGRAEQNGAAEPASESVEPQAAAPSQLPAAEARAELNQRAERSRERADALQEIAALVRAADPAALQELAERLRESPPEESESASDLCLRLGGPEQICAGLGDSPAG